MATLSDYTVNTMTLTASSGRSSIDLEYLTADREACVQEDSGDSSSTHISHVSHRSASGIHRAGRVMKRNGRVRKYSRKMFDNQATVVVHMPYRGGYDVNIKVFRNGNLQMSGARSSEEGNEAANFALGPVGGQVNNVRTHLMNCNFTVSRRVNRQEFYAITKNVYRMQSSFIPSVYPAVKVYYMMNEFGDGRCHNERIPCSGFGPHACCKRVTILVFEGNKPFSSATITGAVKHEQIDAAHRWLSGVVERHPEVVY